MSVPLTRESSAPQAGQSASLPGVQSGGQHPSPVAQAVMPAKVQRAVQADAEPDRVSRVQAMPSSQDVGQVAGGSQVSPGSSAPLPQVAGQSVSASWSHPDGQHPSPAWQATTGVASQRAVQPAGDP
jgi:hypothetical protein